MFDVHSLKEARWHYCQLMAGAIVTACQDIKGNTFGVGSENVRNARKRQANYFLFDSADNSLWSFLGFCEMMELDPGVIREWCRDVIDGNTPVPDISKILREMSHESQLSYIKNMLTEQEYEEYLWQTQNKSRFHDGVAGG